jgi:hypothetical protein
MGTHTHKHIDDVKNDITVCDCPGVMKLPIVKIMQQHTHMIEQTGC